MPTEISATVNRPYVPESGGGITCELDITPQAQGQAAERHIALCIDSSGSMAYDDKLDHARDATELVFGILNDDDYLSIVTFDEDIEVVMDATRWGDIEREEAEERLQEITTTGGTDIYSALEEAEGILSGLERGESISKRVLLLSDGRDTRASAADFEPLAQDLTDAGISIYSAGLGTNYGQDTIRSLGEFSQGRWAHVENPADIRSFFGDVVQEASTVLSNNPELVLETVDGCEIGQAFRRLPQVQKIPLEHEEGKTIIGLPDLQDREEQQVVLEMDAPPNDVGTEETLVDVTLEAGSNSAETEIAVTYSDDESELSVHDEDVTVAYYDTDLRTRIAHADSQDELEAVKAKIDETEVITGETEIADALHENVTRIEEGDESQARQVKENTTGVYDPDEY
ncbi:VWA domain-containing protein [Halobacteria archaeon HArc-gm2]|nr:VWA domain-containing protein [Halobacteria archaeon HArc-gm2]